MQVDFYLLTTADRLATWVFAARLIEKVYRMGHLVQVALPTTTLTEFNQLLWTFRTDSFLPHDILTENNHDLPIILHDHPEPISTHPVLINLTPQLPTHYPETLQRIVELVSQEPTELAKSRERYRADQTLGFTLQTHRL